MLPGKCKLVLWTVVVAAGLGATIPARAASAPVAGSERKVKNKVTPAYPELARRMAISGSVKLEVVVAANGSIKSTKVIGGHPLLVDSAVEAIKKWRYETASSESTELVEFKFTPAQ